MVIHLSCTKFNHQYCWSLHSEFLAKLNTEESTNDDTKRGGVRDGASETKTTNASSSDGDGSGRGQDQSENSLTYTKEQVEVVQRSD